MVAPQYKRLRIGALLRCDAGAFPFCIPRKVSAALVLLAVSDCRGKLCLVIEKIEKN